MKTRQIMSIPVIKIVHNPVTAKVIEPSRDVRLLISELLSYKVPGSEHMPTMNWDGVTSLYQMKTNTFPAGFVRFVRRKLTRAGYKVRVHCKPAPEPLGPTHPKVDDFPEDPRYDYQPEVVERLLSLKGLIAMISTGGGKSKCFKLAAERIGRPTLFVTTRKSLMYQMAEDYGETIGKPFGIMGDGIWEPKPDGVNFAIVDTLVARLEKLSFRTEVEKEVERWQDKIDTKVQELAKSKGLPAAENMMRSMPPELRKKLSQIRQLVESKNPLDEKAVESRVNAKIKHHEVMRKQALDLLSKIEFLTLEEAHEVGSDSFFLISQACVSAHYRLALTATPFMRDDQGANMRLMAATGPIGIKVSEKLLIDRGILAKPYFKFIKSKAPAGVARGTKYQTAYSKCIVENTWRNHQIVSEVEHFKRHDLTSMVLVQQTKHGKNLEKMMRNVGLKARFISGESNQDKRSEALEQLKTGALDVLIGSTILDVGVDVPSVGAVILAGGGKAEVSTRQRIGRGLRAKKKGPNICFIIDFEDQGNNHLVRHYKERRRIIEETPGFVEGIVKHFDFEKLGFGEAA
jgi:superfamily II DNA or RNA helicase